METVCILILNGDFHRNLPRHHRETPSVSSAILQGTPLLRSLKPSRDVTTLSTLSPSVEIISWCRLRTTQRYIWNFSKFSFFLISRFLQANRPLMSLLLPAVVSSNSSAENQSETIAMMKIDCQVTNTQMVHIMKDAIPVHMTENKSEKNFSNDTQHTKFGRNSDDQLFPSNFKRSTSNRTLNVNKHKKSTISAGKKP